MVQGVANWQRLQQFHCEVAQKLSVICTITYFTARAPSTSLLLYRLTYACSLVGKKLAGNNISIVLPQHKRKGNPAAIRSVGRLELR